MNDELEQLKTNGNIFMKQKKYDQAIQQYSRAINLNPNNEIFYSNRCQAIIQNNKQKTDSNNQQIQQALEDAQKWVKGYYRMSQCYVILEEYQKAKECLMIGLQFDIDSILKQKICEIEKQEQSFNEQKRNKDIHEHKQFMEQLGQLALDKQYMPPFKEFENWKESNQKE